MSNSPITSFYNDKVVFITGCTGFLGTVLVEKLLRAFPNLKRIILLIRPLQRKSAEDRINDYRNCLACARIDPDHFSKKISWIIGDMCAENLNLSEENLIVLEESVNIVFHCAANIRLNEPLQVALAHNVKGTQELLNIASRMKSLQCFVSVSSCYSNSNRQIVDEKLYGNKFSPQVLLQLLNELNEDDFNFITPLLVQDWPNTYTFSKHVGEILVTSYENSFPVGIFRADGILGSYKEPFPSWITNGGPNFVPIGVITGVLKVLLASPNTNFGFVPVDMTANALLAAALEVSENNNAKAYFYNYSSFHNPITTQNLIDFSLQNVRDCHLKDSIGFTNCLCIESPHIYNVLKIFYHIIPAYFMDFYLKIIGKQQIFKRLYNNLHKLMTLIKFFTCNRNWIVSCDNVDKLWNNLTKDDQDLLYFDLRSINWKECLSTAPFGIKQFVFKETLTQEEQEKYSALAQTKI